MSDTDPSAQDEVTELDASTDPSPAERARQTRRAHRRRNLRVLGVLVIALALLVGGAWQMVLPMFEPESDIVTDYPGPGGAEVAVVVTDPAPEAIATVLLDAGVVASEDAFVTAYEANPQAVGIQAGNYVLSQQMRAADAVLALLDPANRTDRSLTIPPGWRATQILAKVSEVLGVPLADVQAAAEEVTLPDEAGGAIEGWLGAGSYTIGPEQSPVEVLQQMVDSTIALLDSKDVAPEDRESVLIQASIVEAEVTDPEDRGRVARVMINRFAGCADVGELLQMNSTVAYGLDKSVIDLTLEDLKDDSTPFNTYVFEGLPPTPINSPSDVSIDVVLDPPEGSWCYFVTVNLQTGETRFTDDPDEHEQNRAEYREWLEQWLQEQSAEATEEPTEPLDGSDG